MLNARRPSSGSKFVVWYDKLFSGSTYVQVASGNTEDVFFDQLFSLEVDRSYLTQKLSELPKAAYLGISKSLFNTLYSQCLRHIHSTQGLETLQILLRTLFSKNPSGLEVMEIMAGGVGRSDTFFIKFVTIIREGLVDSESSASVRHGILQVALIYVCGVGQLSPGAYFLRRDLFPAISTFIKSPDTEKFTFEASLLLALLANYHKSDAANLNLYLQHLRQTGDTKLMKQILWSVNFALEAAIKAYQAISDDSPSPQTLTNALASMVTSLRPDRALTLKPAESPRKLFETQPIEAAAVLLLVFEFIKSNRTFVSVFLECLSPPPPPRDTSSRPGTGCPPLTILALSSYLFTHASSVASPRAIAYANLALNTLLAFAENYEILKAFSEPTDRTIRLCRQRQPPLPLLKPPAPVLCALLDCCTLWLRHNLHMNLETSLYLICVRVCHRVIWFLQKERCRLEYHWGELWKALCSLLDFLVTRQNSLATTGGVEQLVRETIDCVFLGVSVADKYLPSPRLINELVYELVRSASTFRKLTALLESLVLPQSPSFRRRGSNPLVSPVNKLENVIETLAYYEGKIQEASARTAKAALSVVANEVNRDGVYGATEAEAEEPSKHLEDVVSFARYAYADGMSLMP